MAAGVDETLEERGEVYGDYAGGLKFRLSILNLVKSRYKEVNNEKMPEEQVQYFLDVIGKMSRLAVSPTHKDSWHDVAGYALLVEGVIDDNK